ncbi:MAG: MFS transporter [Chloroflexota bacterium]
MVEQAFPSRTRAWWMVGVFCFAGFISYVDRMILSVLVDPLQRELVIGDAQLSLLQGAAFAIVYVFAGLPLGILADRKTRRNLIIVGAIIWTTGTLLCGLAPSFWTLFAARILVGVGEAALAPAAASMISDSFPAHQRGTALGVFMMGMVVGGPGSVGVGGALLSSAQNGVFGGFPFLANLSDWRVVLVIVGLVGFIVPILMLTVREPLRQERESDAKISAVLAHVRSERVLLLALLIGVALLSVGDYGLYSWAPSVLTREFDWSPDKIGGYFTLITTITGVIGAVLGGVLSDTAAKRFGEQARFKVAATAALIGAIAAACMAGPKAEHVLFGVGLWTLASSFGAIGGIAALQQAMPNEMRGIAMSFVAFCNTLLGLGLGPTIVASVTEFGFQRPDAVGLAITIVVVPAAILSLCLFLVARNAVVRSENAKD